MRNHESWGKEFNLDLVWTETGSESTCRALVWLRIPMRFAATICVNEGKQYAIRTQGLYGLTQQQMEALESHLESRGWRKREQYSGK